MKYAIIGYNHSIHSVTKLKPVEIINGHLENEDPLNIDVEKIMINDYLENHKNRTKIIYQELNRRLSDLKEHNINKSNERREPPPPIEPGKKIYVRQFKRNKALNRYTYDTAKQDEGVIIKTAKNEKVHKANIKRPLKFQE
ncbi:MAG TPA: hypothetical protein VIQ04_06925 [Nitrososphaeraceae archaeon]